MEHVNNLFERKDVKITILAALIVAFLGVSAQPAPLSDRNGLELKLTEDGSVDAVHLHGQELPRGSCGGFYLREPNSNTRVRLLGEFAQRDGSYRLAATSPLKASLRASWTEGDSYIEIRGELVNLSGADRGLWLGFNVPLDATGWKWGESLVRLF